MDCKSKRPHMDWVQVRLNGGPPCFYEDDDGTFCGRAEAWPGHPSMHECRLLEQLLRDVQRETALECWRIVKDNGPFAALSIIRESFSLKEENGGARTFKVD